VTFPIEKYKDFFGGLILMGSPAQVKNFSKVKTFQKYFQFLAILRWPYF
jgi:hypothetical protein